MTDASKQDIIRKLGEFLDSASILSESEDLYPYECDGLSAYRTLPWLVVLPRSVDQVEAVMRLCHGQTIPVVVRGAGTGLSGGALPLKDGILLSLARLNRILEVDPVNRTARVQPGVRNLSISDAAREFGLHYAPDPSSQIACTIGGNVAENSGGVHCLKYGLTVHNIVQLKIVTADGQSVTIGGGGLDAPGYDLLALMTGSEGLLGVVVEIVVKLLPIPQAAEVLMASFSSVEQAGDAVAAIIGAGVIPGGLEMMDKPAIRAAEDFVHAGYPVDAEVILLCEVDGSREQAREEIDQVRRILGQSGAVAMRQAEDENERGQLWAGRKAAFPAVGRIAPDYYCMDGTIPRKQLGRVLRRIGELSGKYNLGVANVFHAGDGNLHPLILYDANVDGELERAEAFGSEILELCVAAGGTITGEHGVGVEKIDQMCVQFTEAELEQFHQIKNGFDCRGILNPGKAVPTLHRCAELGAMHVHAGELRFPELERF